MRQRWTAGLAHLVTLDEPVFVPCLNSSCTLVPSFPGWTYGSVKRVAISAVSISLFFRTLNSVDLSCLKNISVWDFPGSPVVKTLPCHARIAGVIPGRGIKILHALWPEAFPRSQEVRRCVVQDPAGLTLTEDIFNIPIPSMSSQAFSRILML